MRRILVMYFAALAGIGGWTGPASAELVSAPGAVAAMHPVMRLVEPPAETPPDVLLRTATLVVVARLKQDRNLQTSSPDRFAEMMESTVLPLFDFRRMTRLAVARNWRGASSEQQDALVAGFRALLVRDYATALTNHHDKAITYKPLRIAPGETDVTVKSIMKWPGAERTAIDYDMEKTPSGWKIYDIRIDGISLISTYRSPFAKTIREDGVDALIESLASSNRQTGPEPRFSEGGTKLLFLMYSAVQTFFNRDR